MKYQIAFLVLLLSLALCLPTVAQAIDSNAQVPGQFPSCDAPTGDLKVSYDNGTHWIVGNPVLQSGADAVYTLQSPNYLQCFCPIEGSDGIETDWLGTTGLDQVTIDNLKAQGWLSVDHGTDFALQDMPYLAKNSHFTCKGIGGNTESPSPSPSPTPSTSRSATPSASPSASPSDSPSPTPTAQPSQTPSPSSANTGGSNSGGSSSTTSSAPIGGTLLAEAAATTTGSDILGAKSLAFTGTDHTRLFETIFGFGILSMIVGLGLYAKATRI